MKRLLIILFSALSLTVIAQGDVKRVAILETVDKQGSVPYLKQLMFRSNLTTAITSTPGYEGYDRADLKEILGEQNFQRTGMVSDADIKKIGEFTGAKYVLIAEAVIDGSDMFITAKIIDVETARVLRNSNQLMGTSAAEMQTGSQKVAADLLGASSGSFTRQTTVTNISASAHQSTSNATPMKASTTLSIDGYVDLGLPSGTLWKNADENCGDISYQEAVSRYGNNIPTWEQLVELITLCTWTKTSNGYNVTGPNNKTILFFQNKKLKTCGYWSSTPFDIESYIEFLSSQLNEKEIANTRLVLKMLNPVAYGFQLSKSGPVISFNDKNGKWNVRLVK